MTPAASEPRGRARRGVSLAADDARVAELGRALGASVNARLLAELAAERRARGDDGWVYLSDAAERLEEAPGTVAAAVGKLQLAGLVDERREKGRRYFRARVRDVRIVLDE